MRSERKKQVITLSILVVTVLAISIGFAAFSSTLKVNSGATVTPNPSNFKVVFSSNENKLETNEIKASPEGMGEDAIIDNTTVPTISGLIAKTRIPGDSATYTFYVRNEGQYEAFLNSITFRGKICIPQTGTNAEMANNACDSITAIVNVGSITTSETIIDITGESLRPGESKQVTVTLSYGENGARANGPFMVQFGDISLHYATAIGNNEDTSEICMLSNDVNSDGIVGLSDEVTCGTESFIVIPNDSSAHPTATGDNITLLAKYNLNVGNDTKKGAKGIQNSNATGMLFDSEGEMNTDSCNFTEQEMEYYMSLNSAKQENELYLDAYKEGYGCSGSIPFSETNYWGEVDDGTFVYNNNSLLYPHIENYKTYMKNLGVDVKEASLASGAQMTEMLTLMQTQGLYTNFNFTSFWFGFATSDSEGYMYSVYSFGVYEPNPYFISIFGGVRPIIVIPLSDIKVL